jgi:putative ABC transport system permease protein
MISLCISFTFEHIFAGESKKDNTPPNGGMYEIRADSEEKLTPDKMQKLFRGLRKETGIIISGLEVYLDQSEINTYSPVSAEWFTSDHIWHYPLASGRYYTAEEIASGKKVAMVGATIQDRLQDKNNKQYITIQNEAYEVIGIVGLGSQISLWDNRVFLPATALTEHISEDLYLSASFNVILYNESGDMNQDRNIIRSSGKELFQGFKIKYQGELETENMVKLLLRSQDSIYYLTLIGYLTIIIYAINIVVLWLEKRRFEIGIRKAFGYSDKQITIMIFQEMLGISVFSAMIALFIQVILRVIIGNISKYTLALFLPNIFAAFGIVFLTALITSIWPVIHALKIPPADIVKGGESF